MNGMGTSILMLDREGEKGMCEYEHAILVKISWDVVCMDGWVGIVREGRERLGYWR